MRKVENIPLFLWIRIQLYEGISKGPFNVGDLIPPEEVLMQRHRTSRTTGRRAISRAIKSLVEEELGTHVKEINGFVLVSFRQVIERPI